MKKLLSLLAISILTFNINAQIATDFSGYVFNTSSTSTNIITEPNILFPAFSSTVPVFASNLAILEKDYLPTSHAGNYSTVNLSFNINQVANSGKNLMNSGYIVNVKLMNGNTINATYTLGCNEVTPVTSASYSINTTFTNSPSFTKIIIQFVKYSSGALTYYKVTLSNLNITGTGHTVGINELATIKNGQNLKLYPNPNNGDFKLSFNTNKEKTNLAVFNIQGQLVYEDKLETTIGTNETKLNIEHLPLGVYYVSITNENNERVVQKTIKE